MTSSKTDILRKRNHRVSDTSAKADYYTDIPTSTDDGTSPWSVYMAVMRPRPNVWSLSALGAPIRMERNV
eukprot:scaffold18198_cov145-Skeletonema_marinoi.AAC.1